MEEIWKDVVGYEGLYQVSNLGNVKSLDRENNFIGKNQAKSYKCTQLIKGRMLKPKVSRGYNIVTLYQNHKRQMIFVHRLVAQAFISNPNDYNIINHKNSIRNDNRVENLEWCTYSHNNKEAFRVGFNKPRYGGENPSARKILQYDLDNNFIREWDSIATACCTLKMSRSSITKCLSGERKTAYKNKWKYAKDTE